MSDSIRDDAASLFASSFYQALGYGKSVRQAFDLGLNQIQLSNTPQLDQQKNMKTRKGVEASEVILTTIQWGEAQT